MNKLPTVEEMLKAGMHFGHRTSKWHPKMAPFIFGSRNGIHVIDLAKSRKLLASALAFLEKSAAEGKVILLVGTKEQVNKTLKETAEDAGVPYVNEGWLGGSITNFNVIKKAIKKYKTLKEEQALGKLDKYTKKEQLDIAREIARLDKKVGGMVSLTKTPDVFFIWDIKHENTALAEARKKKLPVVAVCDTNVNPTGVDYIIPGNDDAIKAVKLILGYVGEAIKAGKAKASTVNSGQQAVISK
jgi:small subunit ribosomal protein S2